MLDLAVVQHQSRDGSGWCRQTNVSGLILLSFEAAMAARYPPDTPFFHFFWARIQVLRLALSDSAI